MPDHHCGQCGNPEVIELATAHPCEVDEVQPGDPVGFVHCPDCHTNTPWHLSKGQNHLVCSNRADRKYPKEGPD